MLVEAFRHESYSFALSTALQMAMAQEQLRDVWLHAQHGRLSAWEQAKALALREVHGRAQHPHLPHLLQPPELLEVAPPRGGQAGRDGPIGQAGTPEGGNTRGNSRGNEHPREQPVARRPRAPACS